MTPHVYVSDLDQTLLRDNATLSPFSRDALDKLYQHQILFTVASARSVVSMQKLLEGVRLHLPVIEFNGGFISSLDTGQHLVTNALPEATARAVYSLLIDAGCDPFISIHDGTADRLFHPQPDNEGMAWYLEDRQRNADRRLVPMENPDHILAGDVMAFTVIGRSETLDPVVRVLEKTFNGTLQTYYFENQYSPGWHWITISDIHATKGAALAGLRAHRGLESALVTAFGDHENDLPLFQAADRSCAVANATSRVLCAADEVIGSNNEDGVMRWIMQTEGLT